MNLERARAHMCLVSEPGEACDRGLRRPGLVIAGICHNLLYMGYFVTTVIKYLAKAT